LINTYSAYFQRKKAVSNFLRISMDLFSELKSKGPSEHRGIIKKYYEVLKAITEDSYESRVLDYVDIISWMDSKIRNIPLQTYIENKKP
jgi:hypothetical protein